ncbi:InlB B-repeat-containing protein [Candidatus Saccharibacteria bacterium]|nr:InlB B-repeat-containing protein [Candidatus Saccharibacteria bacterium]
MNTNHERTAFCLRSPKKRSLNCAIHPVKQKRLSKLARTTSFSLAVALSIFVLIFTLTAIYQSVSPRPVSALAGWQTENNARYYYDASGKKLKGLQKIDNKWYLFDKTTGILMQEGNDIYFGSFFTNNFGAEDWQNYDSNQVLPVMYLTLNGHDMSPFTTLMDENATDSDYRSIVCGVSNLTHPNCLSAGSAGLKSTFSDGANGLRSGSRPVYIFGSYRDPSPFFSNGRLYLVGTSPSSANATSDVRDFAIISSNDLLSYDWGHPTNSVRQQINDPSANIWAPRWFSGKDGSAHVMYVSYKGSSTDLDTQFYTTRFTLPQNNDIASLDHLPSGSTGRPHALFENTAPQPVTLNYDLSVLAAPYITADDRQDSQRVTAIEADMRNAMNRAIGGDVFYDAKTAKYYMVIKREHCQKDNGRCTTKTLPSTLLFFELASGNTDFTSWNYLYQLETSSLDPHSCDPATTNGRYPYVMEGASIINVGGRYYMYSDTYDADGYVGVRVYAADSITDNSWSLAADRQCGNGAGGSSVPVLYGSDSLTDAEKGYLSDNGARRVYLRHGSWTKLSDASSIAMIQTAYNGIAIPPEAKSYAYDGKEKTFTDDAYVRKYNDSIVGMPFIEQTGGTAFATNPGVYTVQISPKAGMTWEDGTTDAKSITWKIIDQKTYTIHFDANTGTGNMSNQTYNLDQSTALPANGFTKDGYSFKEWNTKADGTGTSYADGQSIKNLATANQTITLYAIWEKNSDSVIPPTDDSTPEPEPTPEITPTTTEPSATTAANAIANPKTTNGALPLILIVSSAFVGSTALGYFGLHKRR